jgi:hypothetical protein
MNLIYVFIIGTLIQIISLSLIILGFWKVFLSSKKRVAKPQKKILFYISKFLISMIYISLLYPLIFVVILPLLSPDYATGCTSGPGMGYCFSAGVLSAIIIFVILLISFISIPLYYISSSKQNNISNGNE